MRHCESLTQTQCATSNNAINLCVGKYSHSIRVCCSLSSQRRAKGTSIFLFQPFLTFSKRAVFLYFRSFLLCLLVPTNHIVTASFISPYLFISLGRQVDLPSSFIPPSVYIYGPDSALRLCFFFCSIQAVYISIDLLAYTVLLTQKFPWILSDLLVTFRANNLHVSMLFILFIVFTFFFICQRETAEFAFFSVLFYSLWRETDEKGGWGGSCVNRLHKATPGNMDSSLAMSLYALLVGLHPHLIICVKIFVFPFLSPTQPVCCKYYLDCVS